MDVAIVYNEPTLPPEHRDFEQEAGVLGSVAAFDEGLAAGGHGVSRLAVGDSVQAIIDGLSYRRPQVIVNFCEAFAGDTAAEPHLAALFELLGIPYTGSPPECLALVRDKARTKWLLAGAGLPTAPFVMLKPGEPLPERPLSDWIKRGPLFVKPAAEDASLGISQESVVGDWQALERRARFISPYGPILIEPFIDGREFNVGVIALSHVGESLRDSRDASRRDAATCLPITEIEFQAGGDVRWPIVTYDGKWATGSVADRATPVRCPADVDSELATKIREAALAAFYLTGCRDYARVDLRVDRKGVIFILEVNANPDAGPNAGLARALAAAGIEYRDFALRLVETAAGRRNSIDSAAGR